MPERVSPHAGMSDETLEHHLKRYQFAKPFVKDKAVLSIACGNGYGEHMFATEGGAKRVTGYDISKEAIDFAKEQYHAANLEYRLGDALRLDMPDNVVDVVISFETIEHIDDDEGYLKELTRVVRPGGMVIISTPNRAKSYKNLFSKKPLNKYHVREYLESEFFGLLEKHFISVEKYGQKTIFKRRWYTFPAYVLYKAIGGLSQVETREYEVKPYPGALGRETAIFVAVCKADA